MKAKTVLSRVTGVSLIAAMILVFSMALPAQAAQHGISLAKGCASFTSIGEQTQCDFSIGNTSGDPDTLTITSLVDVVDPTGTPDNAGNILFGLNLTFTAGPNPGDLPPSCGPTVCTLPPNSTISTATPFVYHTVTSSDPSPLEDTATLTWQDTCDNSGADPNCTTGVDNSATSGSSTTISKLPVDTETTIHNASHTVITTAPAGATIHDNAVVTGTAAGGAPDGSVTFDRFSNGTCTGAPAATGNSALTAVPASSPPASSAESGSFTLPASGAMSYRATYSGPSNTYDVGSPSGPCERLDIVPATPSVATTIHNSSHAVITSASVGSVVHDRVTVTGTALGGAPTGTVTFHRYATNDCVGQAVDQSGVTLSTVSGTVSAAESSTFTVPAGGMSYQATYNGSDPDYFEPVDGPCEPLAISLNSPVVGTTIRNSVNAVVTSVPAGTLIHDHVLVTGSASVGAPSGSVTFRRYVNGTCSGTASATQTVSLILHAGGLSTADTSSVRMLSAGKISYRATYIGIDPNYIAGSVGPCEILSITGVGTTVTTSVRNQAGAVITRIPFHALFHDFAVVTGVSVLGAPTGHVTFRLYKNKTCTGTPLTVQNVALTAVGSAASQATSSSYLSGYIGWYSYKDTYSGSARYRASSGPCEPVFDPMSAKPGIPGNPTLPGPGGLALYWLMLPLLGLAVALMRRRKGVPA